MKIMILKTSVIMLVSMAFYQVGCNSSTKNLEDAKTESVKAETELKIAEKEYLEDLREYRIAKANEILENEKRIAEYKALKVENKVAINEKIDAIEKKNNELKTKMENYKDDGEENWKTFKSEFNRDMDELGKALKDLTIKNNK